MVVFVREVNWLEVGNLLQMRIRPRWVVLGASTAAVMASLAENNWDVNAIGIVRFGRAAFTVRFKRCILKGSSWKWS